MSFLAHEKNFLQIKHKISFLFEMEYFCILTAKTGQNNEKKQKISLKI